MEIEFLDEKNSSEWDAFCLKTPGAWFRHTTAWARYSACCRFDSDARIRSFMVKQNNRILAAVPLIAEYDFRNRERTCFAMYGDRTPLPAFDTASPFSPKSVMDAVAEQIAAIAHEERVAFGSFFVDPLIGFDYVRDFFWYNLLGPSATCSLGTVNVVNLLESEEEILRKMRKGHKAAIKAVYRDGGFHVDLFDRTNITREMLLKFKEIHRKDAGRQTRTDASWDCMYDWISAGQAFLALLWLDEIGDYACGALIMTYKDAAYYGSFATLDSRLLKGCGGYAVQWSVIRRLKADGCRIYNMGRNYFGVESGKLHEIAKYQRGFRTVEYPEISYVVDYGISPRT